MSKPRIPKTLAAATALLARHAELEAQLSEIEARRQRVIARFNGALDKRSAPIVVELALLDAAIEPWWNDARAELTQGDRKSIELGGCVIGNRATPAKMTFTGTDAQALAAAKSSKWRNMLTKTTVALDRAAIVKVVKGDGAIAKAVRALGFSAPTGETFFITRVDSPDAKISAR